MDSKEHQTFHDLLKKQTMELHSKAHNIPYVANLLKNDLQKISYVGHLRSLAIIYGTLENHILSLKDHKITSLLNNYIPKLPLILSDLEFLNANEVKDIMPAISEALHVADNIMLYSADNPYKLLGYIYTLEGSLNGGKVLKTHISDALNFQNDDGTKYLSLFNENIKTFWDGFISNLNTKITNDDQKSAILTASQEIFEDIMQIYESLYPINEQMLGNHITSLNPEAGNYPIPTNPLEIKAAITAGMNCWNEFPYYEKRFGDRGRRFAVSDAAWLVTLCNLSDADAIKQVNWLANFLAIRGMPTYTMEYQMKVLYEELSKWLPEKEHKYSTFLKAAGNLKNRRTTQIEETYFEQCNSIFYKYADEFKVTDTNLKELKKNMGKLIASSIIDHKNEIPDAKSSLETWLKNKEIFPENWILVVEKTYKEIELFLD